VLAVNDHASRQLARMAGLREMAMPRLEDVNKRRSQLWMLSLLVGLAVPVAIIVLGIDWLPDEIQRQVDLRTIRLALLAMLVAVFGYVAERERVLRKLTEMLVEERVLTASLVSRIHELDLLFAASRAMNSTLDLHTVLDVILKSAYELLEAGEGSIQLICEDDLSMLEVVAVRGSTTAAIGQRQEVGHGLAGGVAHSRDAMLITGPNERSRVKRRIGSALVVPLEVRGELVGVLNLAVGPDREPFTEFDLRSTAVFAETAAAAISNARAHMSTQQTLQSLTELDRIKDEFLAMVTHELRTPLTAMIGIAATIKKGAARLTPEEIAELADMSRDQGWRLDRLVDDLLETSRAQGGTLSVRPRAVDARVAVQRAVSALEERSREHMVNVELPDEPLVRSVDPDALARITENLVGNALTYTPPGSSIVVSLTPWAEGLALTVTDNGPGISEDEREHVFDKFRRGHESSDNDDTDERGGLGLGLFIVRSLAEAHGGRAHVHSGPEGGCRFVVTLADMPEAKRTPAASSSKPVTS
jgi:two-component system, OmpR family, sensor histidine kinase KdpD